MTASDPKFFEKTPLYESNADYLGFVGAVAGHALRLKAARRTAENASAQSSFLAPHTRSEIQGRKGITNH